MTSGGRETLHDAVDRAGLELVAFGQGAEGDVLAPRAAWRSVIGQEAEPTAEVRLDHPSLAAEVNDQWYRLATEHGLIGPDGSFLVQIFSDYWTKARLTDHWDLAGATHHEFVTLSTDGDTLLGVTGEEYAVWLVVETGVRERREAAARALAQETPEERDAAWESVPFTGLGGARPVPGRAMSRIGGSWIEGLAGNPAARTLPVFSRLLAVEPGLFRYRSLPSELIDYWISHPDPDVRKGLAEHRGLTPEQRGRLIAGFPAPLRAHLVEDQAPLPAEILRELAADAAPSVRRAVAGRDDLEADLGAVLARDRDPTVRSAVCGSPWTRLTPETRARLLADTDEPVRTEALLAHHRSAPMPRSVFDTLTTEQARDRATRQCVLTRALAQRLAGYVRDEPAPVATGPRTERDEADRRVALADNPHLPPDLVLALAKDAGPGLRLKLSTHPGLSEQQRVSIPVDIDPHAMLHPLPWVLAAQDDPDLLRRCASSAHLLVRSSVACVPVLPPDIVELLARDQERVVRIFLNENSDAAPGTMLPALFREWDGSLSGRSPYDHPNFPRQGMLRFADDPHPRMRQTALRDPESTPELVERLSRDPHPEVRLRALKDPRLSPSSVVRLLDDSSDTVRSFAARDPRLPARAIKRLLHDSRTAWDAAANPAIPEAVMHRLISRATGR
ncbi:PE-PGRS family protein [Streptomyces albidochromogenes]|uniref:PE-PGRS family protein n=1 Tax=Streptomyces albidochromogenes TaxID=329524 RepID=A0ABW6FCR9_9ACTN